MRYIKQTPTQPNEWLYIEDRDKRYFADYIIRPENTPEWEECTDQEKLAWEEAHKPEEPTEVEEIQETVL